MKIILDGSDNNLGCLRIESQNVPENFIYQTRPLFEEKELAGVFISFGLMDEKEGAQK